MITEIYVEGNKLDITADISSLLTFALDDVKDFSTRATTFSKTVILPGSTRNNGIFGNIFDTGITNAYDPDFANIGYNFNAAKSATCIIFQDNLQTFKGTLRLLEIDITKHQIEYQVALNGDLTTLNVLLSGKLLTDLDFSAYDTVYNVANISASWDNTPGSGVYFPMIDYGGYSITKKHWGFKTFRPALYVKEYIDKMFAKAKFRYACDLFSTPRFKKLIIPHNQKDVLGLKTGTIFTASAATQNLIDRNHGASIADVTFGSFVGGLFSTTDNKTFTYGGSTALSGTLLVNLTGLYNFGPTPTSIAITLQKNGVDYYNDGAPLVNVGTGNFPYFKHWSIPISLTSGDTINIHYALTGGSGLLQYTANLTAGSLNLSTPATILAPVEYGETIKMQHAIPQNIRQVDFLVSIVKLWNLYVYEDQFDPSLIIISPFVNFYASGPGSVIDWTYKMNRDQPISIKPMSELTSKLYNFNYKDDSDYWNALYSKRYNQRYGSYIFDSQFEFATENNTLELIFASTPLVGYDAESKIYPTIFKRTGDITGQGEEAIDSVIRILQTKKLSGVASWSILRTPNDLSTILGTYTTYGYAGHFDDPNNPSDDLNFGGLNEIFYHLTMGVLTRTQFNVYWSAYMAEITDKDSKLLTAKFYLTPIDIFNLSFSKFIYLDGVLWRLNKITDYNVSIPSDCEVQLLKAINTAYSYPIGEMPEEARILDWETDDELEYSPGQPILYL